ncbi:hypothetical protein J2Y03_005169 [Neobacillus niacini]|nr:hypothetical protein [Neobacillus niacini]
MNGLLFLAIRYDKPIISKECINIVKFIILMYNYP